MEVFMTGLPAQGDLTTNGLKIQLEPFFRNLGIDAYDCEKPGGRNFAFITFLHRADGFKFLQHHGEVYPRPGGRAVSQLSILGTAVYCKSSNKAADPLKLKTLQYQQSENRNNPSRAVSGSRDVSQQRVDTTFRMSYLHCGHYLFQGAQLNFMSEVDILHDHFREARGDARVKFTKKNIILKFGSHQIRIPFNSVVELLWSLGGHVTVLLSSVPQFLAAEELTVEEQFARVSLSQGVPQVKLTRLASLCRKHKAAVGLCLAYRFSVMPLGGLVREIRELETKRAFVVTRFDLPVRRFGDIKMSHDDLMNDLRQYYPHNSLPFNILFQLQALAYNAFLHPNTVREVARELVHLRSKNAKQNQAHISMEALKKLFSRDNTPYPSPYEDPAIYAPKAIVAFLKDIETQIRKEKYFTAMTSSGNNLAQIYRVLVTPSRVMLQGPELENQNRILRKFPNHHNSFIRVQFCDENGESMRYNSRITNTEIFKRFLVVLQDGIQLAGRTFSFLGWSHSSLRSHSMWFSAPFVDDAGNFQTYFNIIKALGNFSNIKSPAKCAARIGQAFSETPFTVPLDEHGITIVRIPDIISRDGSRVFSDGVGKISLSALRAAWTCLPHDNHVSPTCLQIRLGGCKGMLALDTRLRGKQIQIRPSMEKFESTDFHNLEICHDTASKPIPLVLNRQLVKILEDMGVSDSFFFSLQNLALRNLQHITSNPVKTAAYLRRQTTGASLKLHKLVRTAYDAGIDYRKEDFLRRVVEVVVLKELRLLKHKARIPVQQGITLFGIVDETGYLDEDQVFVTFDPRLSKGDSEPPPPPGRVLVTRSPALHPGDVQLVNNVIPPSNSPLRMLKNCIVFSSRGTRDLPSQLSGGDLDGDLYNVIWDSRALYKTDGRLVETFEPADYPRAAAINIGRVVEKNDMAEFFVNFMETDQLGVIATRHMILADQSPEGTLAAKCKQLAQMHSTAVDFSKTGIPVDLKKMPKSGRARPDFLAPGPIVHLRDKTDIELADLEIKSFEDDEDADGPGFQYYESDKILGKLYRAIDEKQIWREDIRAATPGRQGSFWTAFVNFVFKRCDQLGIEDIDWAGKTETARMIRSAYDDAIFGAMTRFAENPLKPLTEIEVFIGAIVNSNGSQTNRQRDQSHKLRDEFGRISEWILSQMRQGSDIPVSGYATELDSLELCMACLLISTTLDGADGVRRGQRRARESNGEMESFSLVAASAVLAELDHLSAL